MSWRRRDRKLAPAAARGSLEISELRVRPRSANAAQAGGYLKITNNGSDPDRLVAASSPAAEGVEIHAIKVVGAGIKMQPVARGLAVQAESTVTLQPRGYHLLLQGVKNPLTAGSRLPVTLTFEKAGNIDVELSVEAPGPVGDDILHEESQRG